MFVSSSFVDVLHSVDTDILKKHISASVIVLLSIDTYLAP